MPSFSWHDLAGTESESPLYELMANTELFESKGAVRRLIQQGAVKINQEKQADPTLMLSRPDEDLVIQAGKRIFFKVCV